MTPPSQNHQAMSVVKVKRNFKPRGAVEEVPDKLKIKQTGGRNKLVMPNTQAHQSPKGINEKVKVI